MNSYLAALFTWGILILLVGASAASITLLPVAIGYPLSVFFAVSIAAILYVTFLGLHSADGLLWLCAFSGFLFLGFLFFITLADFITR